MAFVVPVLQVLRARRRRPAGQQSTSPSTFGESQFLSTKDREPFFCAVSSLYFAELGHTLLSFTGVHAGSEQSTRAIGRSLRKLLRESASPR